MTTQYKTLTKGDILQEGDEFKISFDPECWKLTSCVGGDATNSGRYRRPIPAETKQYRRLTKEDILQIGDEFNSCIDGWVPSRNVGRKSLSDSSYRRPIPAETKQYRDVKLGEVIQEDDEFLSIEGEWLRVRRPIPTETKQKNQGSITEAQREIIDSERDKRNSAVIAEVENVDLKTRLEEARILKEVTQAENSELFKRITKLNTQLCDKEAVARRLTDRVINVTNDLASYADFTRQVAEALGMGVYRISFQEVVQKVQSMTFQNASLNIQIKDSLSRNGSTAQAELEKVKNAAYANFTRQVAEALKIWPPQISPQNVLEKVQSLTFRNASLDRQLKDSLSRNGSTAQAELEKVRDAVKNFAKYI